MDDEWLSTNQVAEILGVSRQHVVNLCDRGEILYARFGTHRRVRRADLNDFMQPEQRTFTRKQERSLWLHRAVLGRLVAEPDEVLAKAREALERRSSIHRPDGVSRRYLTRWRRVIDGGVDEVAEVLVGRDHASTYLRQYSPFAGALTDRQRQQVLRSFRRHWETTHAQRIERSTAG